MAQGTMMWGAAAKGEGFLRQAAGNESSRTASPLNRGVPGYL
jgi:hypothetical protein